MKILNKIEQCNNDIINYKDVRGNTPLQLAIKLSN